MPANNRTVSKEEVRQEIDLQEIYGREPTTQEKADFYDAAINKIISRTQNSKSVDNKNFAQYSKEYAEQKGVSRGDVDLTLMGDMLLSISAENTSRGVALKIDDPSEAIKAYAHITGYEGHPTIKNGPKRDFFGLNQSDIKSIANSVKSTSISDSINLASLLAERQRQEESDLKSLISQLGFALDQS